MMEDSEADSSASADEASRCDRRFSPEYSTENTRQHESGYGTDLSPMSMGSVPRQLTFRSESDDSVFELSQETAALELGEFENHVFPLETEVNDDYGTNVDTSLTDGEVESILTDSREQGASRTISDPIDIMQSRPRSSVPVTSFSEDLEDKSNFQTLDMERCSDRHCANCRYVRYSGRYQSSGSSHRSIATQTPPSLLPEAASDRGFCRSEEPQLFRGHTAGSCGSLPDVVPVQRNRSASLPEVPSLRQFDELTMGRTLRRISDEFEYYHRERRRQQRVLSLSHRAELWNTLRRYLAYDDSEEDRYKSFHGPHGDK